jgi:Chaperone of endosialidase
MPGTTTNLLLPYPLGSDPIDVAGDIQRLAAAVDATEARFVNLTGDTMTGPLSAVTLTASGGGVVSPPNSLNQLGALMVAGSSNHLTVKDTDGRLPVVRFFDNTDALIGSIVVDAVTAMDIAGPSYISFTPLVGGPVAFSIHPDSVVSNQPVMLPADPVLPMEAATKQYIDTRVIESGGLDLATAEALYVNVVGDTMTGPLVLPGNPAAALEAAPKQYVDLHMPKAGGAFTAPVSYAAGVTPTSPNDLTDKEYTDATFYPKAGNATIAGFVNVGGYVLIDNRASNNQLYIQGAGPNQVVTFRNVAAGVLGSISTNDAQYMRIVAGVGPIYLRCGAVDKFIVEATVCRSNQPVYIQGQTRVAGGVQSLVLCDAAGPYIGLYSGSDPDSLGTRRGFMGFTSTTQLAVTNEVANGSIRINAAASGGYIDFYTAGVYQARVTASGDFVVTKTVLDTVSYGVGLFSGGRVYTTTGPTTHYNLVSNIIAAVDNNVHAAWRRSDITVGSVQMNGTGAVLYATTSDAELKGNVNDIADAEALAAVAAWHPVSFQWRTDSEDGVSTHAEPSGGVHHGFLAQQMHALAPDAVAPGYGTFDEHVAWLAEREAMAARGEAPEPEDLGPWSPWMMDNSKLVPTLVAAVQALMRQVAALQEAA